jgi:hypothetical protein
VLGHPKLGEGEVVAAMLDHERARRRPGLVILGDKGFAGRDFEQLVAGYGARLLRPDRTDEPRRPGSLGRFRQWIESTFNTLKTSLAGTPRRPDPGRGLGPRRAAAAGPGRMHLVELADRRS